jgi:hypothetical protein
VNPVTSRALERLLILHEDHEQNVDLDGALVGSTGANQFSSISAGINASTVRCTAARTRPCSTCSRASGLRGECSASSSG